MLVHDQLAPTGVLTITLDRPEKRNALNDVIYQRLVKVLDDAKASPDVRCVLIQSEGPDFCAGNDIGDFEMSNGGQEKESEPGDVFIETLASFDKPVVAAVQGRAIGIGATLLLHTDLLFLEPKASIRVPFTKLGLTPEGGSSLILPLLVGVQRAFAMFALGEPIDADTAKRVGLAYDVVPLDDLSRAAAAAAAQLAGLPIAALRRTKRLMRQTDVVLAQIALEQHEFRESLLSPEAAEAFAVFRSKRAPTVGHVPQGLQPTPATQSPR